MKWSLDVGSEQKAIKLSRRRFVRGAVILAAGVAIPRVGIAHAATAETADGTKLFYEATGRGPPIIFLHETTRTYRSFDLQVPRSSLAVLRCF